MWLYLSKKFKKAIKKMDVVVLIVTMAGIYLQKNPTTSVGLRRYGHPECNEGYWLLIIQYLDSSLCSDSSDKSEWPVARRFRLQKLAPEWQLEMTNGELVMICYFVTNTFRILFITTTTVNILLDFTVAILCIKHQ